MRSYKQLLLSFSILGLGLIVPATAGPTYSFEYMHAIWETGGSYLPFGLNDQGQIVATFYDYGVNPYGSLCTVAGGCSLVTVSGNRAELRGINDHGQIVGSYVNGVPGHSFLLTPGVGYVDLNYRAVGINNNGDILQPHFVHLASGGTVFLDVPGGVYQYNGINNLDQVVGTLYPLSSSAGFIQNLDGSYISFQYPGAEFTEAYAINDRGDVVGLYYDGVHLNGYLRTSGGAFYRIQAPVGTSTLPVAINDRGQIAGYVDGNSPWDPHVFLATAETPEPASVSLIAMGLFGGLVAVRRARRT